MKSPGAFNPRILPFDQVETFSESYDVVVCGFGGAGASAALEALRAGAKVLVLERASAGGGATAMSSCEMYLGGGTALQKELGYDESVENFENYLLATQMPAGDPERIAMYAQGAAEHFSWVESLGVPYKRAVLLEREIVPFTDESLLYTGNERAYPFNQAVTPIPRGHVPSREGDEGGKIFMDIIMRRVAEEGATITCDANVAALVQDSDGRVRGVMARIDGEDTLIEARKGVILTMGGFIFNQEMTSKYLSKVLDYANPYGGQWDYGHGILLGMAAGGNTINMDEAFTGLLVYPPGKLTYGILVNKQGQRFINEDCYLARLSYFGSLQTDYEIYLLVQNEDFEASSYLERLRIVSVGETIAEIEQEAGFASGTLQNTVSLYNRYAEQQQDPVFHKSSEWVKPFSQPPFALVSYSYDEIIERSHGGGSPGPLAFSLGGLHTRPSGEVLTVDGTVIPGLYAAGRTAAGVPRLGKNYASGMSVGDATFFGRQAGKKAAKEP